MNALTYHRPQTVEDAIALLADGIPLAGGTTLVPRRRQISAVIDLQDLGLAGIEERDGVFRIGATTPLQKLVEVFEGNLPALVHACRREAALNLRHQATVAGTLHGGGGRSPLLCALLALNPRIELQPGGEQVTLDSLLDQRSEPPVRLATWIEFPRPVKMSFEAVARSPMDRPLVSAAAARLIGEAPAPLWVALGGHGRRPLLLEATAAPVEEVAARAGQLYAEAADAWASGAYRAATARTLVGRVWQEVTV